MREFIMPPDYGAKKTEYAGKEPVYKNKQRVITTSGEIVIVTDYLKDLGLYIVMNIDKPGTVSSAYRMHPDKLVKAVENDREQK